jgi:hypothetical protein
MRPKIIKGNCDICKSKEPRLEEILSGFQTEKVKKVCVECFKRVNSLLIPIQNSMAKLQQSLVKEALNSLLIKE